MGVLPARCSSRTTAFAMCMFLGMRSQFGSLLGKYDLECSTCSCHGVDYCVVARTDYPCNGIVRYIIYSFAVVLAVFHSHIPLETATEAQLL